MKKLGVLFICLLLVGIGVVSAELTEEFSFKQMECMTILPFKSEIIGQTVPENVPISDEIINIFIDNEIYGFIQIEDRMITDFNCSENELATYDLFIQGESTLSDIATAEDQMSSFIEKFNNKEIELKGKTFGKKIKMFFVRIGIKWFM